MSQSLRSTGQKKVRNGRKTKNRNNRQIRFYSGKKKRRTIKNQIVLDVQTSTIISVQTGRGREHDFKLFKRTKLPIHQDTEAMVDSGYTGIQKIHAKSQIPKKRSKKKPLTKDDKRHNREISTNRVAIENVNARLKRFKIVSDRYRNHRKRFGLRINLIAGIYNAEIGQRND